MSRNFDTIAAINDSKETFKIAIRIVDLWLVQARKKFKHLEMVLMDGKRDKIHAIVKKEDLQTWEAELEEGKTYYMYNFRVIPNDGQYRLCTHPFKLFFTGGTTLRQVNLPDIPLKSYDFKSFQDIINGTYDPNILIDVIGIVEEVKLQLPNANPPKVVFYLKDLSGQVVTCTLWSEYANKFIVWFNEKKVQPGCMIVLLTQARIKPPQGVHGLSISNSLYGSKLLINDEVPDFSIYKERLSVANLDRDSNVSQSVSVEQHSQGSEYSDLERFLYKSTIISLSDIADVSDGSIFCTFGTTSKLIPGKGGWFYNSCGTCTKKADHKDVAYTCSCGKFNDNSVPRYRVEIMVSHKKGSGNFVFWDRDCRDIIGMTASALRTVMIESEEGDPKHFPEPLDKMLGLTLAIKCKYQQKFNSYSVLRMSDDPTIIKAITEQISAQKNAAGENTECSISKNKSAKPCSSQMEADAYEINKCSISNTGLSEGCSSKLELDADQITDTSITKIDTAKDAAEENTKPSISENKSPKASSITKTDAAEACSSQIEVTATAKDAAGENTKP